MEDDDNTNNNEKDLSNKMSVEETNEISRESIKRDRDSSMFL